MSNEFEEKALDKILDMSDSELLDYVEVGLVGSTLELNYELPVKVRKGLQTLAYDIMCNNKYIIKKGDTERLNKECQVDILRKRYLRYDSKKH